MKSQITIKTIQDIFLHGLQATYVDDETSRRMWWASIELIQKDFLSQNYKNGGIWVASPLPALNAKYFAKLQGWMFAPENFPYFRQENAGFLPANHSTKIKEDFDYRRKYKVLNLHPDDGYDPFLMIITRNFQCILTIAGERSRKILLMKCDAESLKTVIQLILAKFNQEEHKEGIKFQNAINNLGDLNMNTQFRNEFWPLLAAKLAKLNHNPNISKSIENDKKTVQITEAKLLKAISHEVRTLWQQLEL